MKKPTWHSAAVIAAILLSGCSAEVLSALLAATKAVGAGGPGTPGGFGTDGPDASVRAAATAFNGRWYACGMESRFVDIGIDPRGQLTGQVHEGRAPIFEIRGFVRPDGGATIEFHPLRPGLQPAHHDDVRIVDGMLKGIRGGDGRPVPLQRQINPAATTCGGTGYGSGDPGNPYGGPYPTAFPSYYPSYYPTHYPTYYPTDNGYHTPGPYQTGYYPTPGPYQTGYYYTPGPYETGHYFTPGPHETGYYYTPGPYETGYTYTPGPGPSGGPHPDSSPMPYTLVSEAGVVGNWYMCGYSPDFLQISFNGTPDTGLLPVQATIDGQSVAFGYAKLIEEEGTGHALMSIFYDPVPGNTWIAEPGDLTYYVHGDSLRQAPGSYGPAFFAKTSLPGSSRCVTSEF